MSKRKIDLAEYHERIERRKKQLVRLLGDVQIMKALGYDSHCIAAFIDMHTTRQGPPKATVRKPKPATT